MKHNYIKSMLTALLLLCSSIASAQIEVDGICYVVSETDKSLSVTTSSTKYSGDIVIPESISLSSVTFPERSTGQIIAYKSASFVYNFYAEAGSTVSFKPSFGQCAVGKTKLFVYINNEEVFYTTASYGGMPEQTLSIESSGPQTLKFYVSASEGYASFTASDVTLNLDKETEYSITAVGKEAFYNCTGLKSIEIPNSVTNIDYMAFYGCTGLKSVKMPDNLTAIGSNAFWDCSGLTSIEIPKGVTSIGYGAFARCTGLISITIPGSVTSIANYAFNNCTGLESVYVECTTPPTMDGDGVFSDYTIPLYVPAGSMNAYKAADYWKKFTNMYYLKPDWTEVTIEIGEYGCGTYCSPAALDFSEVDGLKAYSAIGFNSSTQVVTLARVMTTAAETGIFLKGEPGTYTVPVIDECSEYTLNLLVGTLETNTINSTSGDMSNFRFTIAEGDSSPMFYPFEDGTSFSAGKAYLQIPTSRVASTAQKSVNIRFDEGETTGIDEVKGENGESKTIYDLSGRKVETPTRGIYIIGGKKVLVK